MKQRLFFRSIMFLWLIFSIIVLFFTIQSFIHPQLRYNHGKHRILHPFDVRVRYRFGTIDERFGVSRQQLQTITNESIAIWHEGTGSEWFVYDDDAKLTINLIYDERQAKTVAKQHAQNTINQLIQDHEKAGADIERQRQELHEELAILESQVSDWQHTYKDLQERISHANNPEQQTRLFKEQQALIEQKQHLDKAISSHQDRRQAFNERIKQHSQQITTINHAIDTANQHFTPYQFDKGVFNGRQINIYEFKSLDDLRLTLAHELGHALAIGHHNDPTALMYPYAQDQNFKNFHLKPTDIELLKQRNQLWATHN